MAAVNRLAAFLPGGTFVTFTVLAQITADPNRITHIMNNKCRQAVFTNVTQALSSSTADAGQNASAAAGSCDRVAQAVNASIEKAWDISMAEMSAPNPPLSACICDNAVETCGGRAHFWLTVALTIITAIVCFVLALSNTSLDDEDKAIAASVLSEYPPEIAQSPTMRKLKPPQQPQQQPQQAKRATSTGGGLVSAPSITDETFWKVLGSLTSFKLFDWLRAVGSTVIFLVLALLTPPVSTCFWPCLEPVISQTVPLLVAFGISAILAVWNAGLRKAKKEQLRARANVVAAGVAGTSGAGQPLGSPTGSVPPALGGAATVLFGAATVLGGKPTVAGSAAGSVASGNQDVAAQQDAAVKINLPPEEDVSVFQRHQSAENQQRPSQQPSQQGQQSSQNRQ